MAAESAFAAIAADRSGDLLADYEPAVRSSWIATELKKVRNVEGFVARYGGRSRLRGDRGGPVGRSARGLRAGGAIELDRDRTEEGAQRRGLRRPLWRQKPPSRRSRRTGRAICSRITSRRCDRAGSRPN